MIQHFCIQCNPSFIIHQGKCLVAQKYGARAYVTYYISSQKIPVGYVRTQLCTRIQRCFSPMHWIQSIKKAMCYMECLFKCIYQNGIKWTTTQSEAMAGFEPSSLSANDRCGTALPSIVHWPKSLKWTTQRGATGGFETCSQVIPDRCATALLMYCPLASLISSSLKKDRQP